MTVATPDVPSADTLRSRGHRALCVVTGDPATVRVTAARWLHNAIHRRWLGDGGPAGFETLSLAGARRWLGSECDALVVDAHHGFDPNAFGAAVGTVRAGGVAVLLCPPLAHWPHSDDAVNARVAPHGTTLTRSRYLARLARLLPNLPCTLLTEEALAAAPPWGRSGSRKIEARETGSRQTGSQPAPPHRPLSPTASEAQRRTVETLADALTPAGALAAVLTADRGRGKSATLGLLAAQLAARGERVVVTAPSRRAAAVLYHHAEAAWPSRWTPEALPFSAPDALPAHGEGVLLVDEAGGLHLNLSAHVLRAWQRVVFAGTVHGYEGTGRGFALRFRQLLADQPHRHLALTLSVPMRWSEHDPLEQCTHALLALDAEAAPPTGTPTPCRIDRDRLAADETALRAVYALLADAHYRTRPLDLRHLLDGPNLHTVVVGDPSQPIAAALVAEEGGFNDPALRDAICAGTRRPRGHLLPQVLAWHCGLDEALSQRWWRVVRIAVHPDHQRRGRGRALLDWLAAEAQQRGIDALGTSFAGDPGVCRFWARAGYAPVYLGQVREATSGLFAVATVLPLSARAAGIARTATRRFGKTVAVRETLSAALKDALNCSGTAL
ncbi:MAG: GNAT family N-acetyltransferase [Pseudomonadota bacterium]